jgi:hypothetical protein
MGVFWISAQQSDEHVAAFGSATRSANAANAGSQLAMPAALKQRDLEFILSKPSLQPAWAQRPEDSAMRHR